MFYWRPGAQIKQFDKCMFRKLNRFQRINSILRLDGPYGKRGDFRSCFFPLQPICESKRLPVKTGILREVVVSC